MEKKYLECCNYFFAIICSENAKNSEDFPPIFERRRSLMNRHCVRHTSSVCLYLETILFLRIKREGNGGRGEGGVKGVVVLKTGISYDRTK